MKKIRAHVWCLDENGNLSRTIEEFRVYHEDELLLAGGGRDGAWYAEITAEAYDSVKYIVIRGIRYEFDATVPGKEARVVGQTLCLDLDPSEVAR